MTLVGNRGHTIVRLLDNMICSTCGQKIHGRKNRMDGYYWMPFAAAKFAKGCWVAVPMHKSCAEASVVYPMIDDGDIGGR